MPKLTEEDWLALIEQYKAGATALYLANKYGISCAHTCSVLNKRGVPRHSNSYVHRMGNRAAFNENVFATINEHSAYWIGFLLGDGCVHRDYVHIALKSLDIEHLEKFKLFVGVSNRITKYKVKFTGGVKELARITICSEKIVRDLAKFGVIERKSLVAKIPKELQKDVNFWRGLVDADGSVQLRSRVSYIRKDGSSLPSKFVPRIDLSGTYDVVNSFSSFVEEQTGVRYKVSPHSSIFRVYVPSRNAARIIRTLYNGAPVYLERKKKVADEISTTICSSTSPTPD